MPPNVEALRGLSYNTLKQNAELVEDPIFALLGGLDAVSFEAAREFLYASYDSDDVPEGFSHTVYKALTPLMLGMCDQDADTSLGLHTFWKVGRRHLPREAACEQVWFVQWSAHGFHLGFHAPGKANEHEETHFSYQLRVSPYTSTAHGLAHLS